MNITGVLLAAGNSSRFGRDKLVEKLGDSHITKQSAIHLLPHVQSVLVVIAEQNLALSQQLETLALTIVPCATAQQGMAASLACGIQQSPDVDGWMIALADMPFIQPQTYAQIISAAQQHPIVAPKFHDQRGHPVFIGKQFLHELLQLQGDCGAREILRRHAEQVYLVDVDDAGVVMDVDYPDDLLGKH